jgi:hypothetical protein
VKKFRIAAIWLAAILFIVDGPPVQAQSPPLTEWWSFFPAINGCGFSVYPISDDGNGTLSQLARYVYPRPSAANENPVVVVTEDLSYPRHYECGYITISITVVPRSVPKQSKQKLRKQNRTDRLIEKLAKLSTELHPSAPPPKKIEIKGFEAYRISVPLSDVNVESEVQTVEVHFADHKLIRIAVYPEYGDPEKLAETIDYAKLARAMDEFASRIKRP